MSCQNLLWGHRCHFHCLSPCSFILYRPSCCAHGLVEFLQRLVSHNPTQCVLHLFHSLHLHKLSGDRCDVFHLCLAGSLSSYCLSVTVLPSLTFVGHCLSDPVQARVQFLQTSGLQQFPAPSPPSLPCLAVLLGGAAGTLCLLGAEILSSNSCFSVFTWAL